ncbi:MAG: hypothetical protein ABIB79_05150 [archaeon]
MENKTKNSKRIEFVFDLGYLSNHSTIVDFRGELPSCEELDSVKEYKKVVASSLFGTGADIVLFDKQRYKKVEDIAYLEKNSSDVSGYLMRRKLIYDPC